MHPDSYFQDPDLIILLFAVLVQKLGGSATITQEDINEVAYQKLIEEGLKDGSIEFTLVQPGAAS